MNNAEFPKWIPSFLKFAGFYNLAWGVYILNKPMGFYGAFNEGVSELPTIIYPLGAAVLVLGIVYLYTANSLGEMRWFILLGFLTKFLGPVLGIFILLGDNPNFLNYYLHIIFNDLAWVIPMGLAFYKVNKIWNTQQSKTASSSNV